MASLQSLKVLDISYNDLADVKAYLKGLKVVKFKGNPINFKANYALLLKRVLSKECISDPNNILLFSDFNEEITPFVPLKKYRFRSVS